MSWDYFKDKAGNTFIVNWVGVRAIVRSYAHSKTTWEYSNTQIETNWVGPDIYNVYTDYSRVRTEKDCWTEVYLRDFYDLALVSMRLAIEMLERLLAEAREYDSKFTLQNKSASEHTINNIARSVTTGEIAADVLTAIRDASAETLIVGSSFLPGGAKYVALGAGSILKGFGKYQDSKDGNIKAGLAEAAFTFGFGVAGIKIVPKNASAAQAVTLNIMLSLGQNLAGDPAKAWIGGEDMSNAMVAGSLKAGAAPISELIKQQLQPETLQELFRTNAKLKAVAIPMQVGLTMLTDKSVAAIVDTSKINVMPQNIPKQNNEELLDTVQLDKKFIENAVRIYK